MTTQDDTSATTAAVSIDSLVRTQGDFILGPLTLRVPTGSVMGFVGPNGSGKTTTIKSILGMAPIDSGSTQIVGGRPGTRHDQIGVVLDNSFLVPDWTADQAARALAPFYTKWDDVYFAQLLDRFDIPLKTRAKDLSQGQSTKLALALALAHRPELLILDEPTSGLDPLARMDILDVFRGFMLEPDHSILFSTHITTDLEKIADYVHILNDGTTAFEGTLLDLTEQYGAVQGAIGGISLEARQAIVGLRAHGDTYTGLINMRDSPLFDNTTLIETPTLEAAVTCLGATEKGAGQ